MMIDSTAFQCPVVVDNMQDTANKAYAGMPIRLYILKGREVEYAGRLDLDGSTPESVIRSSDTGQRVSYFDSCQLIKTVMSNMCALSV